MKSKICLLTLTSVSFLLIQSCKKDNVIVETPIEEEIAYSNVPAALWDYFQSFEEEAQKRGLEIDLNASNITAEISEIDDSGVAGTCSYGAYHPNHIVIDKTFWERAGSLYKEFVVFHELGHCSLFRGHREDAYPNGTCVSIMRSGLGDCYDNYRISTRSKYLDELFEEIY